MFEKVPIIKFQLNYPVCGDPTTSIILSAGLTSSVARTAGIFNVFPGHNTSYWCFKLSSSKLHVDRAVLNSQRSTMSERSSLNAVQISSVGGGAGSKKKINKNKVLEVFCNRN